MTVVLKNIAQSVL